MSEIIVLIISDNIWLESLLKQYFVDLNIITKDTNDVKADIVIDDSVNQHCLNIASGNRSWAITKPVSILLLINVIIQAKQLLSENVIIIGPISFFSNQKSCKFEQEEILLTQKETEILLYLLEHRNGVDKLTLLNVVWGYSNEISTRTLESHIYKLRSKFIDKYELILSNESGYFLNFP